MTLTKTIPLLFVIFLAAVTLALMYMYANVDLGWGTQPESVDPLELTDTTLYGTLRLTEKIDGSRSGLIVHDLNLTVYFMQAGSVIKPYVINHSIHLITKYLHG